MDNLCKSANAQVRKCCENIMMLIKVIRNELQEEDARKWIELIDQGIESVIEGTYCFYDMINVVEQIGVWICLLLLHPFLM